MSGDAHQIVPLDAIDPKLIDGVLDRAFGADRHKRTAYKIREGMEWLPALSFAALDDSDHLVGTIQAWPVALTDPDGKPHPIIMVGPVAVVPDRQSEGFGKALVLATLSALSPEAPLPQVMIGDADYYGRFFGFEAGPTSGWECPGPWEPERLLVRTDKAALLPKRGMLGPWPR